MDGHFSGRRGPNDEWIWDEPPTSGRPVSRSPRLRFHLRVPAIRWPARPRLPEFRPPSLRLPIPRRPTIRWPGRPPLPAFRLPRLPYLHAPRLPSLHLPSVRLSPLPRRYAPVESPGGTAEAKTARQHPDVQAVLLTGAAIAVLIISTALLALAFAGGSTITLPPSPALTPGPTGVGPASPLALGLWDKAQRAWLFGNISDRAGYKEGDRMLFMVRWAGAQPGTTYEVTLQYDCATKDGAAIDFLSGLPPADEDPATSQYGPGHFLPDAALPLPDDTTLTFDDATSAVLQLWGGSFTQLAKGPVPATACIDHKSVVLEVKTTADTLYLLGSAHLAVAADWHGQGSSAQNGSFSLVAGVSAVGVVSLSVPPHAVTR